jgi:hypothetical protein
VNEYDDVMCEVRESFSGLRMDTPVEKVLARGRVRRRRRLSGLTAAAAAAAGGAAAVTLVLGGSAPAHPASRPSASLGSGTPASASPGAATLAAFTVTSGPGDDTTLIVRKGQRLDPSALREALAQHGIPALVTVGTFCRATPPPSADTSKLLQPSDQGDGSAMVINGQAIPPGARLSIGLFPDYTRMLIIEDGAPLSCASTSHQPAVHLLPSGTPIRGAQQGSQSK